ncbi:MAG: hypothetical protein KGM43_05725 [Planctomycetota bacterium]|nr:hypothetical protein [Planctomycetota bacterium]
MATLPVAPTVALERPLADVAVCPPADDLDTPLEPPVAKKRAQTGDFYIDEKAHIEQLLPKKRQELRSLVKYYARRARTRWDGDQKEKTALVASKLRRDPERWLPVLENSERGCVLLIGRWQAVYRTLRQEIAWTKPQVALVLDMLGVCKALRVDGESPLVHFPEHANNLEFDIRTMSERDVALALMTATKRKVDELQARLAQPLDDDDKLAQALATKGRLLEKPAPIVMLEREIKHLENRWSFLDKAIAKRTRDLERSLDEQPRRRRKSARNPRIHNHFDDNADDSDAFGEDDGYDEEDDDDYDDDYECDDDDGRAHPARPTTFVDVEDTIRALEAYAYEQTRLWCEHNRSADAKGPDDVSASSLTEIQACVDASVDVVPEVVGTSEHIWTAPTTAYDRDVHTTIRNDDASALEARGHDDVDAASLASLEAEATPWKADSEDAQLSFDMELFLECERLCALRRKAVQYGDLAQFYSDHPEFKEMLPEVAESDQALVAEQKRQRSLAQASSAVRMPAEVARIIAGSQGALTSATESIAIVPTPAATACGVDLFATQPVVTKQHAPTLQEQMALLAAGKTPPIMNRPFRSAPRRAVVESTPRSARPGRAGARRRVE